MVRKFIDIVNGTLENPKQPSLLTLLEGKAYDEMMAPVIAYLKSDDLLGGLYMETAEKIRAVAKSLGRSDRSTWFTRYLRLLLVHSMLFAAQTRANDSKLGDGSYNVDERLTKMVSRIDADYTRAIGELPSQMTPTHGYQFDTVIDQLAGGIRHLIDTPYQPMQDYKFSTQTVKQFWADSEALEEQWKTKSKRQLALDPDDQIILKMPNNWVWIMKAKGGCGKEAAAMGHCGNGSGRNGQRLLSLRQYSGKVNGVATYEPYATFILESDGFIGEMKGRFNKKPEPELHFAIKELLKHDLIKGVRGGGYLAQNNFAMADLPEDERKALFAEHPKLMKLHDRYEMYGMTDEMMQIIRDGILADGQRWWGTSNIVKADITPDDWRKLTDKFPEVMTTQDWYLRDGMTEELMKFLDENVKLHGSSFLNPILFNLNSFVSPDDKEKLFEHYPLLREGSDYYEKFGMTPEFMEWIKLQTDIYPPWGKNSGFGQQFELLSDADRDKLFDHYPDLMTLKQYYQKLGMTDELMERIANGYASIADSYWRNNSFHLHDISIEDKKKLFDKYPEVSTPPDYYEVYGMTPELVTYIASLGTDDVICPTNTGWYRPSMFDGERSRRRLIDLLSDEDRNKFLDEYPQYMNFTEHYERLGLDDQLMEDMHSEFENHGYACWNAMELTPDDLAETDLSKLYSTYEDMAPFEYRLEHFGNTSDLRHDIQRITDGKFEHATEDVEEPKLPLGDFENWVFVAHQWTNVHDYIASLGNKDLQYYGAEDFNFDMGHHISDDEIEGFFDDLPEQAQDALRNKAFQIQQENEGDEEDEADASDLSTSEIIDILNREGDGNYYALSGAVTSGQEAGAEEELYEAKVSAIHSMEWQNDGHTVFTMHGNDKKAITWDDPVKLQCSAKDICKALDKVNAALLLYGEYGWQQIFNPDEKTLDFHEPQYGFNGWDQDAAKERFFEEWTIDEDELEKCPYKPDEMTDEQKLQAISELKDKLGRSLYHDQSVVSKDWSSEKITEVLQRYIKSYYV